MDKKVFIILVNYNGSKDTIDCIKSLKDIDYKNYEIVVVDNNSRDEEKKLLRENSSGIKLIESDVNLGFALGNNLGMEYAINNNADYVLLLNNDTLVEKDFLTRMVKTAEKNEDAGAVGCKIMYHPAENIIWYNGGRVDFTKFSAFNIDERKEDYESEDECTETDFITGCCILIPERTIKKAGYLSHEYFMYYEDVDYSLKIKEIGLKLLLDHKAKIYHKVSVSSGGEDSLFRIYYSNRARKLFMKKFRYKVSGFNFFKAEAYFVITRYVKMFRYVLKGQVRQAKTLFQVVTNKEFSF
ncbi:MAG: glycosyltransferase family 2 protein [Clostridiaceae bacterium]